MAPQPSSVGVSTWSNPLRLAWGWRAWRFYGTPLYEFRERLNCGAVGEVRFVLGWIAEQVGRVGWNVSIDGKLVEGDQLKELLKKVVNRDTTVQIATNLLVAGELGYAAFGRAELKATPGSGDDVLKPVRQALFDAGPALPGDADVVWVPISIVYPNREGVLARAKLKIRGVWPHPANPVVPDPPLFGVLDVLEEIEQLQDLAYAQNNSRVAQLGFLEIASEYSFIGPDNGSDFHTRMQAAIAARLMDPRGTGGEPITVTGPIDTIEKGGIKHTKVEVDPDNQLESKLRFAILRLAWGFPVPPEILLGMTSTNRATAYQIEESTYKSHIEGVAQLVGRVYARAMQELLDGDPEVEVEPDPTAILARRSSVPDLQWAYRNGLIAGAVVLEAMGVDPNRIDNLATEDDFLRLERLAGITRANGDERTPSDGRLMPSVTAAGGFGVDLDDLATRLASVDAVLLEQLKAAAARDTETAFKRLGARCRTKLRQEGPGAYKARQLSPEVSNAQLPFALGLDGVRALGIDPEPCLLESYLELASWWQRDALAGAHEATRALVSSVGAELPAPNGEHARSADQLVHGLVAWSLAQLERPEPEEVPTVLLREAVATAGRG